MKKGRWIVSFSIAQVSQRWNCSIETVRKAIRDGSLEAFKLKPEAKRPTWRVPEAEVLRYEQDRMAKST